MTNGPRPQPELIESAVSFWAALVRAVRAISLYEPEHAQVRIWVERAVDAARGCTTWAEPTVFDVRAESVELGGEDVGRAAALRPHLVARLHADGVRQIHLRSVFDARSTVAFAAILAPYQNPSQAPLDSIAERLHWEPLTGLTFVVHSRGALAADVTTAAEQEWRARLLAPRPMPAPEHLPNRTRLASVWNGTGGRIPWPPPVLPEAIRSLEQELDEADRTGVTPLRLGRIVAAVLDTVAGEPRFEETLDALRSQVGQLLAADLPDEASHLLQPVARWAARGTDDAVSMAARRRTRDFLLILVSDDVLGRLLEGAQQGRYSPEQVAAWFAPVPPAALPDVLRFAAAVPLGPYRAALLDVAAYLSAERTEPLETLVAAGRPGPALLALEVADGLRDRDGRTRLGLLGLRRSEPAVSLRAAQLLAELDDPRVHAALVGALATEHGEVRSVALRHIARFAVPEAASWLAEAVNDARFTQLPLSDQLLYCRALGAAGGQVAVRLAWRRLGPHWEIGEASRSAPWIVCLAASGDDDVEPVLRWFAARAGHQLASTAVEAAQTWRLAREGLR